jgi:DNA polymerase-4
MLAQLSRDVAEDLRDDGLRARTIGIKLRFANFETLTRDKTLPAATDSTEAIRKAAFECLGRIELKRPVRLLGVRAGALEKTGSLV